MRVIHEIVWEIIILKIQPVTKQITYFRGDIQPNLFQYQTGQLNRSADRAVKLYRSAMFNVRYKNGYRPLSLISRFLKMCYSTWTINLLSYYVIDCQSRNKSNEINCQYKRIKC